MGGWRGGVGQVEGGATLVMGGWRSQNEKKSEKENEFEHGGVGERGEEH